MEEGWHKHRRINFFFSSWGNKRPWNRARKVDGGARAGGRGLGAVRHGHGHDRGGYGRPGRDIELVAREDGQRASIRLLQKRTLPLPIAAWRPRLPSGALSPLPDGPGEGRRVGSTGAASLVTRPGNVTRSFIRSTPLACPSPIIRAITWIDRFAMPKVCLSRSRLSYLLLAPVACFARV